LIFALVLAVSVIIHARIFHNNKTNYSLIDSQCRRFNLFMSKLWANEGSRSLGCCEWPSD